MIDQECMYSECEVCNGTPIAYNLTETDQEAIESWIEWSSTNVQYKKNNEINCHTQSNLMVT